jgi:phosphatidylcholine synthase
MSGNLVLAWLVHLYTALGTLLTFAGLVCIERQRFTESLWIMFAAVAIDATDGTLARAARVKERIPWFDGARLDDIVDYTTYVLLPVYFMFRAGLLPAQDGWWLTALPLLASAYGFCRKDAKTEDHFFQGFPSYWNVVAFYFYVLKTPLWVNGFTILLLSVMVFVPIRYIYPSRNPRWRGLTLTLGVLWGVLLAVIINRLPELSSNLAVASLAFPAYYAALSFWFELRRLIS